MMSGEDDPALSFDEFDEVHYPRPDVVDFDAIADVALSRRGFAAGALAFGLAGIDSGRAGAQAAQSRLSFKPVAASSRDTVTVPAGYCWHVVMRWGDELWDHSIAFDQEARGTGASQELAAGDNNDGMALFQIEGRSVLVCNNEYINRQIFYGAGRAKEPRSADDVRKGKAGHGVTIAEIALSGGRWSIVKGGRLNRRITADTPMQITGPAAGHGLMQTKADSDGTRALGTWNNCGNGVTPWGTYLTCEENFNGYFSASDLLYSPTAGHRRYGIGLWSWGYGWAEHDERFDISKHPNEPNRAGYVVEIDPGDPDSMPKKRTGLGRFKHENAELVLAADGRAVVYMGDDERGEFLYKYVSAGRYVKGGDSSNLLNEGKLYAASFNDDGTGKWLELSAQAAGMASQAEVCIHTRQAASRVGATTMDRPEWVAANPHSPEVLCCLTKNKNRGRGSNRGGDPMPVGGANPRAANRYGQIVRWRPAGGDHGAAGFTWDLFVLAGNPSVHSDERKGSDNVTADNMFCSPDGLFFDNLGLLWIQTDGNFSNTGDYAGMGNNQMLVADTTSGEIRRFLTGPAGCEVTGHAWSTDRKTLFIGIQHPGVHVESHFPDGGQSVPRSSVIAIQRDDGGVMG